LVDSARKAKHEVSGHIAATELGGQTEIWISLLHFIFVQGRCDVSWPWLNWPQHADKEAPVSAPGLPPDPGSHAVGLHLPQLTDRIFGRVELFTGFEKIDYHAGRSN
jgi:hypothetical protein